MSYKFVRIEVIDSYGISRGLLLTKQYFDDHKEKGINVVLPGLLALPPYNIIVEGTGVQAEIGYCDNYFYPDLSTIQHNPVEPDIISVIGELRMEANNKNSTINSISSRCILQSALKKLADIGIDFYGAFEYEFYLYNKEDSDTYSLFSKSKDIMIHARQYKLEPLIMEIMKFLEESNFNPEAFHFELGQSQVEITYGPTFGIQIADNATRFKQIVKEICNRRGYHASFMSKPQENIEVSSGHMNHSLWDKDKNNIFHDPNDEQKLSEIAKHWLAGLQEHFNALVCLAAPNVNCYERLSEGFGTLLNTWGIDNRSTNFRFKNADKERTFLELRFAGAGTNPYLTMAAVIFAGIDGIERKLKLKQATPFVGNVYSQRSTNPNITSIPQSFEDAITALHHDTYMCEQLGERFMKCFHVLRKDEIMRYEHEKSKNTHWKWLTEQYFTSF